MNASHHNLRRGLQVVGALFLLAGAGTAAYLYQSFGVTFPEKALYAGIGVLLAASGGLLLPTALSLWRAEHPLLGLAAGLIWLAALFPLGVQHHAGFFSVAQADLAAAGLGAQLARAELERLEHERGGLQDAAGLNLDSLEAQAGQIRAEIAGLETERAKCPANYFKNCLNPLAEKISAARARLEPVERGISRAQQYGGLLAEKEAATARLKAESTGATGNAVHPLFDTQGKIAGVDPKAAQAAFLGFTAVTVELLSAALFVFAGGLGGKGDDNAPVPPAQTVPALDTGGRVTGEGLAHLHAGETVLNAEAAAALDKLHPGLADRLNEQGRTAAPLNDTLNERLADVKRTLNGERVPQEMSGKRGKGRLGKVDSCLLCGSDYEVRAWTQVCCCPDHTAQLAGYDSQAARKRAWAKGKK